MSAYVVEDKTINRIVTRLEFDRDGNWPKKQLADLLGFTSQYELANQKIGEAMLALNVEAVNQRYNQDDKPMKYKYKRTIVPPIQALKSLSCWLYQCSEGDVPERPLYKILRAYEGGTAKGIIQDRLPEYSQAEWG